MTQGSVGDIPVESWWSDYVRRFPTNTVPNTQNSYLTKCQPTGDQCERPLHYNSKFHPKLRRRRNHYQSCQPCRCCTGAWQQLIFLHQACLDQHRPELEPWYTKQSLSLLFNVRQGLTEAPQSTPKSVSSQFILASLLLMIVARYSTFLHLLRKINKHSLAVFRFSSIHPRLTSSMVDI